MEADLLLIITRGLTAAGVAMSLVWGTVEWILPNVKSKQIKRLSSLILGTLAVVAMQEAHLTIFGEVHPEGLDIHNRIAAVLFGLLAGGFTPLFHSQIINRFAPMLKKK